MLSESDFAAKIKAKYPQYAKVPDAILVQKIIAKHPEYKDSVQASWTGNLATAAEGVSPEAASSSAALAQHVQDQQSAPPSDPFNPFPVQGASNLVQKAADSGIPAIAPLAQGAVASMNNLESGLDTAKQGVGEVGSAFTKPDLASGVTEAVSGTADVIGGGLSAAFAPLSAIIQKTPVVNTIFEKLGQGQDELSGFLADKIGTNQEEKDALKKSFNNLLNLGLIKYGPGASEKVSTAAAPYISDMAETIKPHVDNAVGAVKGIGESLKNTGLGQKFSEGFQKGQEGGFSQARVDRIVQNRVNELSKLESGNSVVRKAVSSAERNLDGFDVKQEIAKTDLLDGAVSTDGVIRTTEDGGAVSKVQDFIKPQEKVISQTLEREGKTVSLADVEKQLNEAVNSGPFKGAAKIAALKRVAQDIEGYGLEADANGDVPVSMIHDAKIDKYANINYTNPESAGVDKLIARTLKQIVEKNTDSVDVKALNKELSKNYAMLEFLKKLDGKRVSGGRLGKYFGQTVGAIVGAHFGPFGSLIGSELGSAIKGGSMARTFNGTAGGTLEASPAMQEAMQANAIDQSSKSLGNLNMSQSSTTTPSMNENNVIDTTIQDSQGKSSLTPEQATKDLLRFGAKVEELGGWTEALKAEYEDLVKIADKKGPLPIKPPKK